MNGVPSGSYLVEVLNPDFYFEPVRVDITSKGKMRARKVNNVQPTQVQQLPYPLKFKTPGKYRYFQKREEWKISDVVMNPMVMMMVLPLLLISVLPKMMNDPDTKKEMEQMQQNMNVQNQVRIFFWISISETGKTDAISFLDDYHFCWQTGKTNTIRGIVLLFFV